MRTGKGLTYEEKKDKLAFRKKDVLASRKKDVFACGNRHTLLLVERKIAYGERHLCLIACG